MLLLIRPKFRRKDTMHRPTARFRFIHQRFSEHWKQPVLGIKSKSNGFGLVVARLGRSLCLPRENIPNPAQETTNEESR